MFPSQELQAELTLAPLMSPGPAACSLPSGFPLVGFRKLLRERKGCQPGGQRGRWTTSQRSRNREHPKGNYCLHATLLVSVLILLLYGNICQAISLDFHVGSAAGGRWSFITWRPRLCSPQLLASLLSSLGQGLPAVCLPQQGPIPCLRC